MKHPINNYPKFDADAHQELLEKVEEEFEHIMRPMNHAECLYADIRAAIKIPSLNHQQVESRKQALRDHLSKYFPELWTNE